jgi:hypothetical protein
MGNGKESVKRCRIGEAEMGVPASWPKGGAALRCGPLGVDCRASSWPVGPPVCDPQQLVSATPSEGSDARRQFYTLRTTGPRSCETPALPGST